MDPSAFGPYAPGKLVEANLPASRCAFVPHDLSTEWEMPSSLWPLVVEARESIGRLDGIGSHIPNHNLLLRPLQQREALRSSSMEGTYATPQELFLFQADPEDHPVNDERVSDWREVDNYARALAAGQAMIDDGYPLSRSLLRALHAQLMRGVRGQSKEPGEFRRTQVQVGHDARFVPPPPEHMEPCLEQLSDVLQAAPAIDPLVWAFVVHYQFETIHPFKDGNGRVGRLLLSLQFYQAMGLSNPWLYMSAFFERYKDEYINGLFQVSAANDWEQWLTLCLRGARDQADDAIRRVEALVELRDRFRQLVAGQSGASARLADIVEGLFATPVVTAPELTRRFDVTYPTAKSDIKRLSELGILEKGPSRRRPQPFLAGPIIKTAFDEG